jgi:hypothetical protein
MIKIIILHVAYVGAKFVSRWEKNTDLRVFEN